MAQPNLVPIVYTSVVNDVINNVREAFLEESVDEQALLELKQLWESKLRQSKAVEGLKSDQEHMVSVYAQQQTQMQQQQQKQRQQQQKQQQQQQHQQQQQQAIQVQPSVAVTQPPAVHLPLFNPATGTVDLSGAAQAATIALPAGLYHQQMAALGGQTIIQAQGGAQYIIQAGPGQMIQPNTTVATTIAQAQNVSVQQPMIQLDGANDSSSDDDDDANDDDDDDHDEEENAEADVEQEEEEPLCSDDDVTEEDAGSASDTENVVVCQFDKIHRSKNRWKFHLKDGIMNLNGRDYVFQKATGDAEW